jgi:hypothetical protein
VKTDSPIDAVVLRKGKKVTIKGLSLPEGKGRRQLQLHVVPGQGGAPILPGKANPLKIELDIDSPRIVNATWDFGAGKPTVTFNYYRRKDSFEARHQEGKLTITVTGSVAEGKGKVKRIEIQDGGKSEKYESLDKVPEQYRDKVKNLIEMSEKQNKFEMGANSGSGNNSSPPAEETLVINLEKVRGTALIDALNRILAQIRDHREAPPVFYTASDKKLTVKSSDTRALQLIREICRLLDNSAGEGDFEVILLKNAKATDAARILDEAFNGTKPEKDGDFSRWLYGHIPTLEKKEGTIRIVADPTSNALLIRAKPLDMLTIRQIVEKQIDDPKLNDKLAPRNWNIILKHADAKDVSLLLKDIYKEHINNARGLNSLAPSVDLTISYDKTTNSVYLSCNPAVFNEIYKLVKAVDSDAGAEKPTIRGDQLKNVDPDLVQRAVDALQGKTPH